MQQNTETVNTPVACCTAVSYEQLLLHRSNYVHFEDNMYLVLRLQLQDRDARSVLHGYGGHMRLCRCLQLCGHPPALA
jgi:hypothetical protein